MGPELILAGALFVGLALYAILGGADFGCGVWEVNAFLRERGRSRRFMEKALGPVWEANHVWLIFVLTGLFGAFPKAFGALVRDFGLLLCLALLGIVLRGAGYAYRAYSDEDQPPHQIFGVVFALASTAAPFFLGLSFGAVIADEPAALAPLPLFCGFFYVGVCAFLAAVYLLRETRFKEDAELRALWRRRAVRSGLGLAALAVAGLAILAWDAPRLWQAMLERGGWLVVVAFGLGLSAALCLARDRIAAAAPLASAAVCAALAAALWARFPVLIGGQDIAASKAPERVLWSMIAALGLGAITVGPSLALLFALFKAEPEAAEGG